MTKKHTIKTQKTPDLALSPDETAELQLILDRLAVQSPNGESFTSWLQSLKNSLEGRQDLVAALLQKLSRQPSDVGFRVFETLKHMVDEKRLAKLVKQAGYRFTQRGYVPDVPQESAERVVLVPAESRTSLAHMAVGSSGCVFLTALISLAPSSHPVGISAFFENDLSQLSVKSTVTSTKQYREFTQNMSGLFRFSLCEIPVWHAALVFKEMVDWAGSLPPTADARQAEQLMRSSYEPGKLPYAYELMAPVENPDAEMVSLDVEPLFELVPAEYLVFSKEELMPLSQRLSDLENSVLVIPQELKLEQAEASIRSTIETLCVGARRERFRRLFEELALWLKLSRREGLARSAWVVAQHIMRTSSLGQNLLLQQLVYLSLRKHWPGDFRTKEELEEAAQPYQETESGLILLK